MINELIDKDLKINELQNKIEDLEQKGLTENGIATMYKERIDKAIEYIKEMQNSDLIFTHICEKELLEILGDKE